MKGSDGWAQLLPDDEFSAIDGRPHDVPGGKWKMNAEIAARVIAKAKLRKTDFVIDYEHQTLSTKEGIKAPASGWWKGMDMEYRPGQGLFIRPSWTATAQAHIDAKEYRYLSAVFPYDKATGEVMEINMAALTNYPGADGMEALASLAARHYSTTNQTNQGVTPMSEAMKKLLGLLGITVADGSEPSAEQTAAATAALTALLTKAASADGLQQEVAALKADTGNVDLSKFVPASNYNQVLAELAALKASNEQMTVGQLIEKAEQDGKMIIASEKDYLTSLGNQSMAALKAVLDSRPVVAALKGKQTTTTIKSPDADDKTAVAALTADQKKIADQMGMSHDELAKELGVKA
ncbi:phage protease [Rheinheimera sp. KL1]|uniref:phage protease n=1 Tax=Rheinheimera sp. KL1 TaxID=1635005 RepID=UPI00256F12B3|nr:phage protease [Rheinheimera sp. KL1]